jgi:hypothetical protein
VDPTTRLDFATSIRASLLAHVAPQKVPFCPCDVLTSQTIRSGDEGAKGRSIQLFAASFVRNASVSSGRRAHGNYSDDWQMYGDAMDAPTKTI